MSNEIAEMLQANKVQVFGPDGQRFRLSGLDVVHEEVQLTVLPLSPVKVWTVVLIDRDLDSYAAPTLAEALELAHPDRGAVVVVWEVEAADAGAARLAYTTGKRLFQFVWLGA